MNATPGNLHADISALQKQAEGAAFIGIRRVCEISGLSKSSILRRVKAGTFPRPVLEEANTVRYDLAEIMSWRRAQFEKRDQRMAQQQTQEAAQT